MAMPKEFSNDFIIDWGDGTRSNRITTLKESISDLYHYYKTPGTYTVILTGICFGQDNKTFLEIGTSDGSLKIEELQMAGKKRMDIKTFLMGCKF